MKKILSVLLALLCCLAAASGIAACEKQQEEPTPEPKANVIQDGRVLMGMYHITPVLDDVENQITFQEAVEGDEFDVFTIYPQEIPDEEDFDKYCQMVYDAGKVFWMGNAPYLWNSANGNTLYSDVYVRLAQLRDRLRSKPYYDAYLGSYVDEPLLAGVSGETLREATKAHSIIFPDKRFCVVFSAPAFAEDLAMNGDRMRPEYGEYITDMGFDMYGEWTDKLEEIWDTMTSMFEGQGKRFWAVPMAMNYRSMVTEQDALDHINNFYELVKDTEGGAGMLLYSAYTYPASVEAIGNIGFCDMAYTTKDQFMTWKDRGDPWAKFYAKYYDENGNQVTPGVDFEPWTKLDARIKEIAAELAVSNENKFIKANTVIDAADGQTFTYDGSAKMPQTQTFIPGLSYEFAVKGSEQFTAQAPAEIGEYTARISLKESIYRTAAQVNVDFSIVDSGKTVIAQSLISEDYASAVKTVAVDLDGLQYSLDGGSYSDYARGTKIDITGLIVREGRNKCVYFRQNGKEPYVYNVRKYENITVAGFESAATPAYSKYTPVGTMKHSGNYGARLNPAFNSGEGIYVSEMYFSDMEYALKDNAWSFDGCLSLEFWVYAADDWSVSIWLLADTWCGVGTPERFEIPKNTWTKVSFDLSKLQEISASVDYTLDHLLVLSLLGTAEDVEVYIDDISVVGIR